jgi:hypothetical protein
MTRASVPQQYHLRRVGRSKAATEQKHVECQYRAMGTGDGILVVDNSRALSWTQTQPSAAWRPRAELG